MSIFKDLIWIKDNTLDFDFCQRCIDKFENDPNKVQGMVGPNKGHINLEIKISTDLNISNYSKTTWKEEDEVFYQSLNSNMNEYYDCCKKVLNSCEFSVENLSDTGYQIQRTNPGEYYHWHADNSYSDEHGFRLYTFIWYLNDIHEDGYTEFIDGTRIQPKAGRLLFFPATWTYVHRGVSPKSETKYLCTGWIYSR